MAVRGNIAALRSVGLMLAKLSQVPSRTAAAAAERIEDLIDQQFSDGTDPYGNTWEALATGVPSHLTDTTALRSGIEVKPMRGAGVSVTVDEAYAGFHQTGTSSMPARPILPYAGLPSSWNDALEQAAAESFSGIVRGG